MKVTDNPNVAGLFSLVTGAAEAPMTLNAFDLALLNAGIGDMNLVRMSSILPPGASQTDVSTLSLPPGGFLPVAYAHIDSTSPGSLISAAVAAGIPEEPDQAGVIMEFEDQTSLDKVKSRVEQMVRDAFDYRNRPLKEIKSVGIEHKVRVCGAVFAGVVLWDDAWGKKNERRG